MMRNRRLADKIAQQGWGAFADRLQHKAERAGLQFRRVDPRHTSQECSECGHRLIDKLTLKYRVFVCPQCGLVVCRDINAAVNIRDRGYMPVVPGGEPSRCAPRNKLQTEDGPPAASGQTQTERTEQHRKTPAAHAA